MSKKEKVIYLTFDDGPVPEVTPRVLDHLKDFDAKATFFCIGGNVIKYPHLYQRLLDEGHSVGNHTFNHMNGWEFSNYSYLRNVAECKAVVESDLFRPPYGKISRGQGDMLSQRFKIIMWSVLSVDYHAGTSPEKCLKNVINHAGNGSIVVFHDSKKAARNMLFALPRALDHFSNKGFKFSPIPMFSDQDIFNAG